jgi:hypothetical protein
VGPFLSFLRLFRQWIESLFITRSPPPPVELPFGLRTDKGTGSISARSNQLQITGATFRVGDQIIVELGGEAGRGQFGTVGVGGVFPASVPGIYYLSQDAPLALVAKVTAVNGSVLTLDKSAVASSTNANVYFDNGALINKVLAEPHGEGWTVTFPAGVFATSEKLVHYDQPGWTIAGSGTTFFSPKGVGSASFHVSNGDRTALRNFTVHGNHGLNGFGFFDHDSAIGGWLDIPAGCYSSHSDGVTFEGIDCIDVFMKAAWSEFGSNVQARNCKCRITDPHGSYLAQWFYGASDSLDCTFTNCEFDSPYLNHGFEAFRSNGIKFIDCKSKNGSFSSNSSGNFVLENFALTVTALSKFSETSFNKNTPSVNINSNIQPPSGAMLLGGMVTNLIIDVQGIVDATGNYIKGVVINADNPNITIDGTLITYAGDRGPGEIGPFGVVSTGDNATVKNLTVSGGLLHSFESSIDITSGTVTNCTAERIKIAGVVQ